MSNLDIQTGKKWIFESLLGKFKYNRVFLVAIELHLALHVYSFTPEYHHNRKIIHILNFTWRIQCPWSSGGCICKGKTVVMLRLREERGFQTHKHIHRNRNMAIFLSEKILITLQLYCNDSICIFFFFLLFHPSAGELASELACCGGCKGLESFQRQRKIEKVNENVFRNFLFLPRARKHPFYSPGRCKGDDTVA